MDVNDRRLGERSLVKSQPNDVDLSDNDIGGRISLERNPVWGMGKPMKVLVHEPWLGSPSDLVGLDPMRAKNLVLECFVEAQHEAMIRDWEHRYQDKNPNLIRLEAQDALHDAFDRTGGDYDNPDKASLVRVSESLAETVGKSGTPRDIVGRLTRQIAIVLAALPD